MTQKQANIRLCIDSIQPRQARQGLASRQVELAMRVESPMQKNLSAQAETGVSPKVVVPKLPVVGSRHVLDLSQVSGRQFRAQAGLSPSGNQTDATKPFATVHQPTHQPPITQTVRTSMYQPVLSQVLSQAQTDQKFFLGPFFFSNIFGFVRRHPAWSVSSVLMSGVLAVALVFIFRPAQALEPVKKIPSVYTQPVVVSLGSDTLSLTPVAGRQVAVRQENERYIYEQAYENTDVVQTTYPYKIKEELIFKKPGHPLIFSYRLGNVENFMVEKDPDGNIIFHNKAQYEQNGPSVLSRVFTIPTPYVEDKTRFRSFSAVDTVLDSQQGLLTITIDAAWLSQVQYPVTLDPTIEFNVFNTQTEQLPGGQWQVNFTTAGAGDLVIEGVTGGDKETILGEDIELDEVRCGETAWPVAKRGEHAVVKDWSCAETGRMVFTVLRRGSFSISSKFITPAGELESTQDLYWGVAALNTNKSIYQPGETAYLQMGVLDDSGNMVCNASLELTIEGPEAGVKQVLSTANGDIRVNKECQMKQVTSQPDYEAYYQAQGAGIYQMTLIATTPNGKRTFKDFFEVREDVLFDVERVTATRIYPGENYPVTVRITPREDFRGLLRERVPADFVVISAQDNRQEKITDTEKLLTWRLDLRAGQDYEFSYEYDAPNISPEFYLLGPLQFLPVNSEQVIFEDRRQWQIAVDAFAFAGTINNCFATAGNGNTMTSWSPQANEVLLLAVIVREETISVSNVVGNGLTWTQVADVDNARGQMGISVFRASSASTPSSGSITFDHNTSLPALAIATRISGADITATNGVEASNTNPGAATDDDDMLVSLSTVTNSALAFAMGGQRGSAAFSPGADETEEFESAADCGSGGARVRGHLWYITSPVDPAATVELGQANSFGGTAVPWSAVGMSIKPLINTPSISGITDSPDPVSRGSSVDFAFDWTDGDAGELVKAKLCKSSAFASQNCTDGFWASSTVFTPDDPETLTYFTTAADSPQIDWWGYVCDDSGLCSAAVSGNTAVNSILPSGVHIQGAKVRLKSGTMKINLDDLGNLLFAGLTLPLAWLWSKKKII